MNDTVKRGSRRNFFMVDNAIFDKQLNLNALDKLVYICLLRYADNSTKECFPAQQTIADDLGISRKRVNEAIRALQQVGLVEKQQRFDKSGSQKSNIYIVFDANEVINRVSPEVTPPVTSGYTPCNSELHHPVTSGYTNNTHLKILSEEERTSCTQEEWKNQFKLIKKAFKGGQ